MGAEQIVKLGTATVEIRLRNISSRFITLEEREKLAEASRLIFERVITQVDIEIIAVESIQMPGYYCIGVVGKFVDGKDDFTIAAFTDNLLKSLVIEMGSAVSLILDAGQIAASFVQAECSKDQDSRDCLALNKDEYVHPPFEYAN